MENEDYGVLVQSFSRNSREEIRISINEFRGVKYIDIRVFYRSGNGDECLPTKKGVTMSTDKYHELLDGVIQLGETLGYDFDAAGKE